MKWGLKEEKGGKLHVTCWPCIPKENVHLGPCFLYRALLVKHVKFQVLPLPVRSHCCYVCVMGLHCTLHICVVLFASITRRMVVVNGVIYKYVFSFALLVLECFLLPPS